MLTPQKTGKLKLTMDLAAINKMECFLALVFKKNPKHLICCGKDLWIESQTGL